MGDQVNQRKTGVMATAALLLVAALGVSHALIAPTPVSAFTPRSPIFIEAEWQFNATNGVTGGSGTAGDPYVIEGWEIDASSRTGISIVSTSSHFVIRNVTVHSGGSTHPGITLWGARNGRIDAVASTGNRQGITVVSSADVTVEDTNVSDSSYEGIVVEGSANVRVAGNTVSGRGVGIRIHRSTSVSVEANDVTVRGIGIWASESPRVKVLWNRLQGVAEHGIGIYETDGPVVSFNDVAHAGGSGVYISNSHSLTLTWNELTANDVGAYLYFSSGLIHHNRFIWNEEQSWDTFQGVWDNGYPDGGNWWYEYPGRDDCSGPSQDVCPDPDGIGDEPYYGGSVLRDRYPLIPPTQVPSARFTTSTRDAFVGEAVLFDATESFDADGTIVSYQWTFGDGVNGTGAQASHAYDAGGYLVELIVTDDEGNAAYASTSLDVYSVDPVSLVRYEHPSGFSLPVPAAWLPRVDEVVEGSRVDLTVVGPVFDGFATNLVVVSDPDPSVRESQGYLEGSLLATVEEVRQRFGTAEVFIPITHQVVSGHAAATIGIQYPNRGFAQKIAVVASEDHGRIWVLVLSVAQGYFRAFNGTFDQILVGFETPPLSTSTTNLLPSLAAASAGSVAGLIVGVGLARSARRRSNGGPGPPQT